jgi:hypothetical protein
LALGLLLAIAIEGILIASEMVNPRAAPRISGPRHRVDGA